ncbi:hypothetical protein N9D66_01425 [Candidatus Nanopelagicales bacterium]|nr:hypothetical protein [Candidatus Nanopelagicales bacterium]
MTVVKKVVPGVAIAGLALVVAFGFDRALRVAANPATVAPTVSVIGSESLIGPGAAGGFEEQVVGKANVQVFTISTSMEAEPSVEIDTFSGPA